MSNADVPGSIPYQEAHPDQSHVPNIIAAFTVGLVLAYLGIAARLYSRHLIARRLRIDDYLALVALLGTTVYCVLNFIIVGLYGFGKHQIQITNPVAVTKFLIATEVIYNVPIFCFKASICTLLMHLFPVRWFYWSQITIIGFVLAYSITGVVIVLVECVPLKSLWDSNVPSHCIDSDAALITLSAFNIFTDLIIIVMPMPLLWGLNMSTSRKLQLTIMIGLGALVFIASIVRIVSLTQVSLLDPGYSDAFAGIWSALELGLGTLGVCIPTYGPLVTYIRGGRAGLEKHKNTPSTWSRQGSEHQALNSRSIKPQMIHDDDYHSSFSNNREKKDIETQTRHTPASSTSDTTTQL